MIYHLQLSCLQVLPKFIPRALSAALGCAGLMLASPVKVFLPTALFVSLERQRSLATSLATSLFRLMERDCCRSLRRSRASGILVEALSKLASLLERSQSSVFSRGAGKC